MSPSHGRYILERDGCHSYHSYSPFPLQTASEPEIDSLISGQLINTHRLLGKLDRLQKHLASRFGIDFNGQDFP
jgi:hypothetical protein